MDLSRELQIDHTTIRTWLRQASVDRCDTPGLTTDRRLIRRPSSLACAARMRSYGTERYQGNSPPGSPRKRTETPAAIT